MFQPAEQALHLQLNADLETKAVVSHSSSSHLYAAVRCFPLVFDPGTLPAAWTMTTFSSFLLLQHHRARNFWEKYCSLQKTHWHLSGRIKLQLNFHKGWMKVTSPISSQGQRTAGNPAEDSNTSFNEEKWTLCGAFFLVSLHELYIIIRLKRKFILYSLLNQLLRESLEFIFHNLSKI